MTDTRDWQYSGSRILVFARAPNPGEVKTRLAQSIGVREAARVYAGWLSSTIMQLHRARLAPLELWVTPDARHPLFRQLADSTGVELHTQPDGELGARMHQVMQRTLEQCDGAVLIGSDCPVMTPDYVRRALAVMHAGVDTVLGPAEDGGYVLLGMREIIPSLFTGIPWSTTHVMKATRRQLRALPRNSWAELERLWDIDTLEDYERWRALQDGAAAGQPSETDKEVKAS